MSEDGSSEVEALACGQDECRVSESGECLEGFTTLDECPYYGEAESSPAVGSDTPDDDTDKQPDLRSEMAPLASREALAPDEAKRILRSEDTRFIVVAGPAGSGKTTLVSSIYSKYQSGEYAGHLFGGSRSLVAFEQRRHLARVASNRIEAETERTVQGFGGILHLRLVPESGGKKEPINLLFTDLPGEDFTAARDSDAAVQSITGLERADHYAMVLDGERLVNPSTRHSVRYSPVTLLRRALETGSLGTGVHLELVTTKWDVVLDANIEDEVTSLIEETAQSIRDDFGAKLETIGLYETACQPKAKPTMGEAWGGEALVRQWITSARDRAHGVQVKSSAPPKREYQKFSARSDHS